MASAHGPLLHAHVRFSRSVRRDASRECEKLSVVLTTQECTCHYAARCAVPFGGAQFALTYFPSTRTGHATPGNPGYAYRAAHDWVHADERADPETRLALLQLMLQWAYGPKEAARIRSEPATPAIRDAVRAAGNFGAARVGRALHALGPVGEDLARTPAPKVCDAVFSLLCLHEPHTHDADVARAVDHLIAHVDARVPVHYKLYALCLDVRVPADVRARILLTTRCTRMPTLLPGAWVLSETPEAAQMQPDAPQPGFPHAEASRVLAMFQLFETGRVDRPSVHAMVRPRPPFVNVFT